MSVADATKACWILRKRGELRRDLVERASLLLLCAGTFFLVECEEEDGEEEEEAAEFAFVEDVGSA